MQKTKKHSIMMRLATLLTVLALVVGALPEVQMEANESAKPDPGANAVALTCKGTDNSTRASFAYPSEEEFNVTFDVTGGTNNYTLNWSVDNTDVISVDTSNNDGAVFDIKGIGDATITCTFENASYKGTRTVDISVIGLEMGFGNLYNSNIDNKVSDSFSDRSKNEFMLISEGSRNPYFAVAYDEEGHGYSATGLKIGGSSSLPTVPGRYEVTAYADVGNVVYPVKGEITLIDVNTSSTSKLAVTITDLPESGYYIYESSEIRPAFTAAYDGTPVTPGAIKVSYNDEGYKYGGSSTGELFARYQTGEYTYDGTSCSYAVKVNPYISISVPEMYYGSGKQYSLNESVTRTGDNGKWTYKSSDETVLKYAGSGKFEAVKPGTVDVTITYDSDEYHGSKTRTVTVHPAQVYVTGLTVKDKEYDGTADAGIDDEALTIDGILEGDDVEVTYSAKFADAKAGKDKDATLTITLSGEDSAYYEINEDGSSSRNQQAEIYPAYITVDWIEAEDKWYDGTTVAEINDRWAYIDGILEGDDVEVTFAGEFEDAEIGEHKLVTATAALSGKDAGNYVIDEEESYLYAYASIFPDAVIMIGETKIKEVKAGEVITGENWSYSEAEEKATLTLDGFRYSGANPAIFYQGEKPLEIVYKGSNFIMIDSEKNKGGEGIVGTDIILNGVADDGGKSTGFLITGGEEGCAISAKTLKITGESSIIATGGYYGFYVCDFIMDGGMCMVEGKSGIFADTVKVTGGILIANGTEEDGICAYEDGDSVIFENCTVLAACSPDEEDAEAYGAGIYTSGNVIIGEGANVIAYTANTKPDSKYGIAIYGTIINKIPGTGWPLDLDDDDSTVPVAVSEAGQRLSYKAITFSDKDTFYKDSGSGESTSGETTGGSGESTSGESTSGEATGNEGMYIPGYNDNGGTYVPSDNSGSTYDSNTGSSDNGSKNSGSGVKEQKSTSDTAADGTKTTTVTTTYGDGSKSTETVVKKPDGSVINTVSTTGADGTNTEKKTEEKADGSTKTTTTVTSKDGSKTTDTVEKKANGTEITTQAVREADGSSSSEKIEKKANGTVTTTYAARDTEGNSAVLETVEKPDGSITSTLTEKDAEGNVTATAKVVEKTKEDGTKTITTKEKNADGSSATSKTTVKPDGSSKTDATIHNADGTVTKEKIKANADGSATRKATTKDENGKTVSTEKEVITVDEKGTVTSTTTVKNADGSKSETVVQTKANGASSSTTTATDAEGNVTVTTGSVKKNGNSIEKTYEVGKKGLTLTGVEATTSSASIPAKVKVNGKKVRVTSIGENAFEGAEGVKTINLTANITKIAVGAFNGIDPDATFVISAKTDKEYNKLVKKIKASGVADTVKFERAENAK